MCILVNVQINAEMKPRGGFCLVEELTMDILPALLEKTNPVCCFHWIWMCVTTSCLVFSFRLVVPRGVGRMFGTKQGNKQFDFLSWIEALPKYTLTFYSSSDPYLFPLTQSTSLLVIFIIGTLLRWTHQLRSYRLWVIGFKVLQVFLKAMKLLYRGQKHGLGCWDPATWLQG